MYKWHPIYNDTYKRNKTPHLSITEAAYRTLKWSIVTKSGKKGSMSSILSRLHSCSKPMALEDNTNKVCHLYYDKLHPLSYVFIFFDDMFGNLQPQSLASVFAPDDVRSVGHLPGQIHIFQLHTSHDLTIISHDLTIIRVVWSPHLQRQVHCLLVEAHGCINVHTCHLQVLLHAQPQGILSVVVRQSV